MVPPLPPPEPGSGVQAGARAMDTPGFGDVPRAQAKRADAELGQTGQSVPKVMHLPPVLSPTVAVP